MIEFVFNFVPISLSMYIIKLESICQKFIFNFVVKSNFKNIHDWKCLFYNYSKSGKSTHKYNLKTNW